MSKQALRRATPGARITWSAISLALILLLIEFFDELSYGIDNAVLPALRTDLMLTYAQVGILLGAPKMIGTLVEPVLMLLGDTRLRKTLIIGGGLAIAATMLLVAGAHSFAAILVAFIMFFPSSGAFVTLSQATLMDSNHGREPQMMARWTVFGSAGNLIGPLIVAGGFALGWGWRWIYVGLSGLCMALVFIVMTRRFPGHGEKVKPDSDQSIENSGNGEGNPAERHSAGKEEENDFKTLLPELWRAVRNQRLQLWYGLLELSDLMLDVFAGYVALYFADVVGLSTAQVGVLLSALMFTSLLADLAVIPLLEKVPGRTLVRISAAFTAVVYVIWLSVPWIWAKIGLAMVLRFSTLGWYSVLQGEAYATLPGRSGTVMALNSLAGLLGGALVWLIGWTAGQAGLPKAMWLLLLGPVSLVLFVPRVEKR
jgi:FSR family fosmidomycin resistance protein-like MFS transporter